MATGQIPPINPALMPPNPLMPPPTTPPVFGFQVWAQDPANAHKVQAAMTGPGQPLQPNHPDNMSAAAQPPAQPPMASIAPPAQANTMAPPMQPMQDKMAADQARLTQLQQSGAGANHVKNPFLHALAKVGDIAAPFILGGGAEAIPGTTVHNRMLQRDAAGNIERDQTAIDSSLKAQEMGANTAHLQMETAQGPQKLALDQMKANSNLAQHGLKTDENGQIVADETSPAYQKQKAMSDYLSSRQELAEAQKQLTDAKTKNQPVLMRQAQQRLNTAALNAQTAIGRLGLSEKEYSMHAYGTDGQGNALPGALLDDDGTPIGTANAPNVRPTAKQRDKIDLAGNAQENIKSIKAVIAKRPDLFGPVAGRKTDIDVWLGSQDPDAQTVRAAMEGGGLALAGIHGTRGEYAVKGIHDVLGNFKTNPQALNAGLDQLLKSSESFSKPHSLRTAPGRNNMQPPTQGGKTGDPLGIR